jgi:hypothetical protein
MGIIKSSVDLLYTFRFLKLLVTPFEDTDAYKAGIIDAEGQRRKDFDINKEGNRELWSNHYTSFHRLVYNVKRFMTNIPGGKSRIATYAAALYLIRENYGVSEKDIQKGMLKLGIDPLDLLSEGNHWFVLEDKRLSPGVYRVKSTKILNKTFEEKVNRFDKVRVESDSYPVGSIFGLDIYEATHMLTGQKIYITAEEILK